MEIKVSLGKLQVGDYFLLQGRKYQILGQLNDISYCYDGEDDIAEFYDFTIVTPIKDDVLENVKKF